MVSENIKNYMSENNLSPEIMAVIMGVTRQTVYHYICGDNRQGIDGMKVIRALKGFCEHAGVSASDVLGF